MSGTLAFAFAAGAVATMNPCGFALLPAYLARQLADDAGTRSNASTARALSVAARATVGFLAVFAGAGSAVALAGRALTGSFPWIGFAVGLLLSSAGLAILLGRPPRIRLPRLDSRGSGSRLRTEILFGIGYGLASLSCALPLFLATLGTALTGSLLTSAFSFVAYALGMGSVLTVLALAAAFSRQGLARSLGRLLPYLERASGALLLAAGLYVTDYWAVDLWRPAAGSPAAAPVSAGGKLATGVSTWLASAPAKTALLVVAASLLTVVAACSTLRQRAASRSGRQPTDAAPAPAQPVAAARHLSRRLLAMLVLAAVIPVAAASAFAVISREHGARTLDRSALLGFVDPAAPAPPFALRDQFGNLVRLNRLRGRPIVIAFVYSHCRDACPLTAAKIHSTQLALGPGARRISWLAVSVEPRTDTTTSVRAFSRHRGLLHSWQYLYRPQAAVVHTLKAYGIQPQLTEAPATKEPFLQHSAYVALLDRNGRRIESFTDASLTSADLTHDLRLVLGEKPNLQPQPDAAPSPAAVVPAATFAAITPKLAFRRKILSLQGTDLLSGRTINIAADAGKPVVLNAWASWCAGCAAEAPALAEFARAHPEVAVVGVDLEDSRGAAVAFVGRFALPFPSIFDPDGVSAARLGVSGLPTTIFLDRRHRIVSRTVGEADRSRFEAGLRQAEQP